MSGYQIRLIDGAAFKQHLPEWIALLQDVVNGGASVGFLRPLQYATAATYWGGIAAEVAGGERLMWGAFEDGKVIGSVQLEPSMKENGRHRAEVQKLMRA
jgi:acetyltransferase